MSVKLWGKPLPRPTISHSLLNLIVTLYVMSALNHGFWSRILAQYPGWDSRAPVFALFVAALTMLLLELLGPGRAQKPVAAVLILIAASASYYEKAFGVLIDHEMIRNIFSTNYAESRQLFTLQMAVTLLVSGIIPAALVFWPKVRRFSALHQLWRWPLGVALCFAVMLGTLFSHYKDYSALLRERHDVLGAYQPGASLAATWNFAREELRAGDPIAAAYGQDAAFGTHLTQPHKPILMVLFVGETARAQNFGLNGYARDTTPLLAGHDIVNFPQTTACGTSTAVSVPCMFSGLGQADYSREKAKARENLLDVLTHAGLSVQWWDNNTGDQNVAKRLGWNRVDQTIAPEACTGECTDEAFLPLIRQAADSIDRDTVLVLHMIGSHGPAYALRYPRERATFQPDCQSSQFSDCSTEEIVNAYDNSIRETDYVLSQTIDLLAKSDRVTSAMVYISDHGESLGENGLYLHAAPSFMAPPEQRQVPFVMWLDPRFSKTTGVNASCLQDKAVQPVSHDNLFPTMLGLLDITSATRDLALDLTAGCRTGEMM